MHGDHIGGLLKNGKVVFPNAEVYINRIEAEAWKAIALTKKTRLHIKIPQRKFIGDSSALNKKIEELIISTINKLTQDGVSTLHPH